MISAVFTQFAVAGSARAVWLWLKDQHLSWPLQQIGYRRGSLPEITWVEPTYHAVHTTLTHPAYAGAYVYGRSRQEQYLGQDGTLKKRRRGCPQTSGRYSSPATTRASSTGTPTRPTRPGWPATSAPSPTSRAPARCGKAAPCARAWPPAGPAAASSPSTTTGPPSPPPATTAPAATSPTAAASATCGPGGTAIDAAVADAFLAAIQPAALQACLLAARQLEAGHAPSSTSTAARSSRPATRPAAPNAATGRSTRKTGWSPAAWKPSGTPRWPHWPTPRTSWLVASSTAPRP